MTESQPSDSKEIYGPHPLLRDILAEVTFAPGRTISSSIDGLDLGVFHEEARVLANECFTDPDEGNFGKFVFVTGAKKVLLPRGTYRGNRQEIQIGGLVSMIPKKIAEEQKSNYYHYLGMIIHTSWNTDRPISIVCLRMLLNEDTFMGALPAIFIVGKTQNMLIFRGQDTPQWTDREAEKKGSLWIWQLQERLRNFIKPAMSLEESEEIVTRAQKALLRQICAKYDLAYFAGPTDNTIVTRQTP